MRLVLMASVLAVLTAAWSDQAWATKAKMEAFQQTLDGSDAYWDLERNIFLNPALIGRMDSFVALELGGGDDFNGATGIVGVDSAANPRAEGGFIKKGAGMHWGLYLSKERDSWVEGPRGVVNYIHSSVLRAATGGGEFLPVDNTLDIFVAGGNEAFAWGVDLSYASSKVSDAAGDSANTDEAVLTAGASGSKWHAAVHLPLVSASKGVVTYAAAATDDNSNGSHTYTVVSKDDELKGTMGYYLVGAFDLGMGTLGVRLRSLASEQTLKAAGTATKWTAQEDTYVLAWTQKFMQSEGGSWFYQAEYFSRTSEADTKKFGSQKPITIERSTFPITIGMEKDATSWLTLRGSVRQAILLNEANVEADGVTATKTEKRYDADASTVNLGASLNFDKVRVDAILGDSATGTITGNNLFSRVAAVYNF